MPYAVHTASTTGQSELNTWLEVSWAHIAQSCHFCRVNQEHIVYLKFAPEALADRLNSGKVARCAFSVELLSELRRDYIEEDGGAFNQFVESTNQSIRENSTRALAFCGMSE